MSNHNLLAMPVILEQKDNVDALVQKVSMLLCLSQCISDEVLSLLMLVLFVVFNLFWRISQSGLEQK